MSRVPIDRTHGGATEGADAALDFSVSLNPLGPPPEAISAFRAAPLDRYPDPDARRLRGALARRHSLAEDHVLVAAGSTAVFHLLARTLDVRRPHVVVPTFSGIANALAVEGRAAEAIPLSPDDDFAWPEKAAFQALDDGADAIFLGRPNSPTGTLLPREAALRLAERSAERGAWCVIDEAFVDFVGEEESLAEAAARSERLVVVRSLTKIYAIPALRLGWAVGPAALVERLAARREPWSIAGPAEAAALACLALPSSFDERTRALVAAERARLVTTLERAGLRPFPSQANFVLVHDPLGRDLAALLARDGIRIRDLASLPGLGRGFFRVGIRDRSAHERLENALRNLAPRS